MATRAFIPVIIAAAAAALASCASLTAEAPLFSPADQVGPAPLTEGVWISVSERCPERNAHRRGRLPRACYPAELSRLPDGAWLFRFQDHVRLESPEASISARTPRAWRFVITPAIERRSTEAYAPLYVAEFGPLETTEPTGPAYAVIAPIGTMPAAAFSMIAELGCDSILRDGPIEGVAELRNERGDVVACVAANQAAVREAARRNAIENLNRVLSDPEDGRFVLVRP